ncbi:MAG: protocatechuate 3,4-dioxygenase [Burkholderiales bacterium]
MARLAAAFGSSHSVMLTAELGDWLTRFRETDPRLPFYDREGAPCSYADVLARAPSNAGELITPAAITGRFEAVQEAMARLKAEIAAAALDALIIVGDDQYELFQDQHMPSIGIYYGATIRNAAQPAVPPAEWHRRAQLRRLEEKQDAHYPCHRALALHLIACLVEREFDVAAIAGLAGDQFEGHAYSFVHRRYLNGADLPIVPIFLNTYNPPNQPHPRRCVRLGAALRELVASFPENLRVGLLASGGLSHFVVEEDLDRAVLDALKRKDTVALANLDPRRLKAGSSEIRNWIVAAGAAADLDLSWVSYTPAYRTPALTGTGLCFARWS